MTLSDHLTEARARVAKGWIQGFPADSQGNVCMLGALRFPGMRLPEQQALAEKIAEMYPDFTTGMHPSMMDSAFIVTTFNDVFGRTKDEVLAVFDKAILAAQERGD